MKFRTQLVWFPLCVFFVICLVVLYTMTTWSDMQSLFERSEKVSSIFESVDEMQHVLKDYKSTNNISHIKRLEGQANNLQNSLKNLPIFPPYQQTLVNSIDMSTRSMEKGIDYIIADEKITNPHQFKTIELMLDKLFINMEVIREDTHQLNAFVTQELKTSSKVQLSLLATASIASGLILLLLSISVSKKLQAYLKAMHQGLEQVRKGELKLPIKVDQNNEENELSTFIQGFNELSLQLQQTMVSRDELQEIIDKKTDSLKKLANTDPLTQVSNRRKLLVDGNNEIARAYRYDHRLSILIIDADNFKQINDNYGHPVGDRVLINLCRLFEKEIRSVDSIGRYGGEEFVILLPETELDCAKEIAERIRSKVSEQSFYSGTDSVTVTVSVGVATLSDETDLIALIDKADHALYEAKHSGKNVIKSIQESSINAENAEPHPSPDLGSGHIR